MSRLGDDLTAIWQRCANDLSTIWQWRLHKAKQQTDGLLFCGKIPGRGERIRTSGLYVPNVALYRAKLHPDW
jgi:hypothetical protein